MFRDYRLFFKQYVRRFHDTGAIAPSSRWLAAALARHVAGGVGPRRVLEVGPGTGAVTRRIVERLGPDDRLDLVELNEQFVAHLQGRFRHDPHFAAVADRATIIHAPLEDLPREQKYDTIVSGLPLNNFAVVHAELILAVFGELLAPHATLSFFEYVAVRPMRAAVSGRADRERLRGIGRVLNSALDGNEFQRDLILPNLPPAWVHHLRFERSESRTPACPTTGT
ncbi:MAG TPA: methyltransferase domain-containing protein [Pirellulales bacterium]|jgi:phospholipid N-methyltransferase|nr:methyltransferase domain-containing protein [Pirellulales bacterium]